MALIACERCGTYLVADATSSETPPPCPRCRRRTRRAAAEEIRAALRRDPACRPERPREECRGSGSGQGGRGVEQAFGAPEEPPGGRGNPRSPRSAPSEELGGADEGAEAFDAVPQQ